MKNERAKIFLRRNAEGVVAYCVLFVVLVLFAANQADFFTVYGPQSIFNQVITLCIAALGQTVIILTSGIDLSVGSLIIFTNCVAATIFAPVTEAMNGSLVGGSVVTILIVLLIGVLAGFFNGCFVSLWTPAAHHCHIGDRLHLQWAGPVCPSQPRRRRSLPVCPLFYWKSIGGHPHVCHHPVPGGCMHLDPLPQEPLWTGPLRHWRK